MQNTSQILSYLNINKYPFYFQEAFSNFSKLVDFSGKRVLEIGGSSLSQEFCLGVLNCSKWVCVDILSHAAGSYQSAQYKEHYKSVGVEKLMDSSVILEHRPYQIFDGMANSIPDSFNSNFDIAISINAFEHILGIDEVLDKIHSSLVDDGVLVAEFGPIWSGFRGSHFWLDNDKNFMSNDFLPPFAHLLMDEEDIRYYLKNKNIETYKIDELINQFFNFKNINRLFFEDYDTSLSNSKFSKFNIKGTWEIIPPKFILEALVGKFGNKNFVFNGIKLIAYK